MENPFETFGWQLEKAKKALEKAKAIEAEKLKNGARYLKTGAKEWKLTTIAGEV